MTTLKRILLALLGVVVLLLVYGVAIEPRLILDVEEEVARVPNLPAEWEGQRIAVIADLQVGMWLDNTGMMRRAVREAIELRPAAVLLAGDFIYTPDNTPADVVREAAEILRPLAASGIPTYAVLGNHDWGLYTKDGTLNREAGRLTREMLNSLGIQVLHNQAITLRRPQSGGTAFYLAGIGSEWAQEAQPARALDGVPGGAPRVVFMHNPESFAEIPAGAAPLAISGHTHGGQIRIPGLPTWSWLKITSKDAVHADGWIEGYGAPGNHLYVNRGIGFSTVPIRIFCAPELTIFALRNSVPQGHDG